MSTTLLQTDNIYVNRFYGGPERGVCSQITNSHTGQYVQLTQSQLQALVDTVVPGNTIKVDLMSLPEREEW